MATLTLRPTSATGTSWQNTGLVYDGNTSQAATVSINSSNYSQRTLTVNFSTSSIPQNAQITKATLTVIAKQSSSTSTRRITVQANINGSSSSRVINQQLTSTSNTTLTADIANYMGNLSSLVITGVISGSSYQSQTFSIYEIYVDVEYQEANVTLTNLTLNITNEEMEIDDTITLRCTLIPSTANSYNITWSSNNNNVQLTKNGTNCTVRALTSGTSTVTVTDTVTGLSATCTIKIKNPYEDTGQQIEIYLPQPLGTGDKLYWDDVNNRYFIQHSTGIIQTEITQKIEFDTPSPYVKIITDEAEVAPSSISVDLAMKEITDSGGDSGEIVIGTIQGYDDSIGWTNSDSTISTDMIPVTGDIYIKVTPTDLNDTNHYYINFLDCYDEDNYYVAYQEVYNYPDCTNTFELVYRYGSSVYEPKYIRAEIWSSETGTNSITPDDVIVIYKIVNASSGGGGTEQEGDWVYADMQVGMWLTTTELVPNPYAVNGLYHYTSEIIYLDGLKTIKVRGIDYEQDMGLGAYVYDAIEQVGMFMYEWPIDVQDMVSTYQHDYGKTIVAISIVCYHLPDNDPTVQYKLTR